MVEKVPPFLLPFPSLSLNLDCADLRVERPLDAAAAGSAFVNLWSKGLPEDDFWQLFLQCASCKVVMPRDAFSAYHADLCKSGEVDDPEVVEIYLRQDEEVRHLDTDSDSISLGDTDFGSISDNSDLDSISGDTEIIEWSGE